MRYCLAGTWETAACWSTFTSSKGQGVLTVLYITVTCQSLANLHVILCLISFDDLDWFGVSAACSLLGMISRTPQFQLQMVQLPRNTVVVWETPICAWETSAHPILQVSYCSTATLVTLGWHCAMLAAHVRFPNSWVLKNVQELLIGNEHHFFSSIRVFFRHCSAGTSATAACWTTLQSSRGAGILLYLQ